MLQVPKALKGSLLHSVNNMVINKLDKVQLDSDGEGAESITDNEDVEQFMFQKKLIKEDNGDKVPQIALTLPELIGDEDSHSKEPQHFEAKARPLDEDKLQKEYLKL